MPHLALIERCENAAGAIVAGDGVAIDAVADNLRPFEHHAAQHLRSLFTVALLNDIDIAAVGIHHLAAVAAAGAEADVGRFQHHHIVTGFGRNSAEESPVNPPPMMQTSH